MKKLAGPHLPASLKRLESAVARAHRDLEAAEGTARQTTETAPEVPDAGVADADDTASLMNEEAATGSSTDEVGFEQDAE